MKKIYIRICVLLALQIIAAAICSPYADQWGFFAYFYSGIVILLISVALPFTQKDWPVVKRIGYALLFLFFFFITWVGGMFLGGIKVPVFVPS